MHQELERAYSLKLPDRKDIPDDIEKFYEDLGSPFYHSLTRKQIKTLSSLQIDIWKQHLQYKKLLILKSQKIGISSLCILITLWHALKDCSGMQLIINAQSDEQAKTHAQDLRRILIGSEKYRDFLITHEFTGLGLLRDEVSKVHTIWLHNKEKPQSPTKIIVTGMSPGALLSHKEVAFIWSSDMTISGITSQRQYEVWAAMLSRLAISQGPIIVECPARIPAGPVFDTYERYEKQKETNKIIDPQHDFFVKSYTYKNGIEDGFFTTEFIEAEKLRLGPIFGAFYNADFFSSGNTWYKKGMLDNEAEDATNLFIHFNSSDDDESDIEET